MTLFETVFIRLFVVVFEMYMFHDLMSHIFFCKQSSKLIQWSILALLTLAIFCVNMIGILWMNILFFPTLCFIASCFLYTGKYMSRIFFTGLYYFIICAIEYISEYLFNLVSTDLIFIRDFTSTVAVIAGENIISFLIFKLIQQFVKQKSNTDLNAMGNSVFFCFLLYPISSYFIFTGIYFFSIKDQLIGLDKTFIIIGCFTQLVANVVIFYVFERYCEAVERTQKMLLIEQRMDMESKHYAILEEKNRQNSKFMHNWNNNMSVLSRIAMSNQDDELSEIVKEMGITLRSLQGITYSDNRVLNAILCDRRDRASLGNVRYDVEIRPGFTVDFINGEDLIVMLGNMLDNALEANENVEGDKFIQVDLYTMNMGAFSVLRIKNSCDSKKLRQSGNTYLSTKEKRAEQGIGLMSIQEMAEKYNGRLSMECNNDIFTAMLVLPIVQQENINERQLVSV